MAPRCKSIAARAEVRALLAALFVLAAAGQPTAAAELVRGAGATFPAPLYKKWIEVYTKQNPDVSIEYQAIGSGEGVARFLDQSVDFGASDAALSDEQISRAKAGVRLVPATAGVIVLAYNLPGVTGTLKLSRAIYVDIFAGRIRWWNDPRLVALNPGLALPRLTIEPVCRQDSSGTTYAFTNHLSAISVQWRDFGPGVGKVVGWPSYAMVVRGNEGVASRIKLSEGAIGYLEYGLAKRLGLPMAQLENQAGRYVSPDSRSGAAALATGATQMPANLRVFFPDPAGEDSYPIVTFTWLLLRSSYPQAERGAALGRFIDWALTEGQRYSDELGYIPLPPNVAERSRGAVASLMQ